MWYAEPYLILMLEPSDKLGRHILSSVFNNVKNLRAVYCPVSGLPFTKNNCSDTAKGGMPT